MIINGKKIKRSDVIKWIANKLGGAHFEEKKRDKTLSTILSHPIFIQKKHSIFYELQNIIIDLAESSDIKLLINSTLSSTPRTQPPK